MSNETECGQQVRSNDSLGGCVKPATLRVIEAYHCSIGGLDDFGEVAVMYEDGDWLASVPADIEPDAMRAVFRHGAQMYQRGKDVGHKDALRKVRAALGFSDA